MSASRMGLATACTLIAGATVQGDFSGPYAPDQWSFTSYSGGYIQSHTSEALVLVGGDISLGGGPGDTDITVVALAGGPWSFDWSFVGATISGGFDGAYYLINGVQHFIYDEWIASGSITVTISAGDVIGFRMVSIDGIFGPATLTITNFNAPVPGPGTIALFLSTLVLCSRRRCRNHSGARSPPCIDSR